MSITKTALAVATLFGLASAQNALAVNCVNIGTPLVVEGNKTTDICLKTSAGGTGRRFSFSLSGTGVWIFDGSLTLAAPTTSLQSIAVTSDTAPQEQHYTLRTSGLPITGTSSSANYGTFSFCYKPVLNETCPTTQTVQLRVDPIVVPDVTSINYSQEGQTNVTVRLGDLTDNPTVNAQVNATCTQANGATVSVSPASLNTNASGVTPAFTINATNLTAFAATGNAPSGICTFSTAGGTKNATVNIQGRRIAPTVTVNPQTTNLPPGSTSNTRSITVTVKNGTELISNAPINVSCQAFDGAAVAPTSALLSTTASGTASINVTSTSMVSPPNGQTPSTKCTFALAALNAPTSILTGVRLWPAVALNPSSIIHAGERPITVSLGNNYAYPDFEIQASCSSARPDVPVSVTPASKRTNTAGQATFTLSALQLGYADANLSALPNAQCTFKLVPGGSDSTLFLPSLNACTNPALSPLPAACGNP